MVAVAVLLAVVAALLFALSAAFQHRAAHGASRLVIAGTKSAGRRTFGRLLGSPTWLIGAGLAGVGFGFHAAALQLGSIALVQPLLTLTLPISVIVGGARERRTIERSDWAALATMCLGVVAFIAVTAAPAGAARPRGVLFLGVVAAAGLTALLTVVGRGMGPAGRATMWGCAAAVAFGITATLTKAMTADLASGAPLTALTDWPLWGLLLAAVAGIGLEQAAFAAGPITAVMVPVTLLNPVAACVIASFGWHQSLLGGAAVVLAAISVAIALSVAGVVLLSRSALLQPAPRRVS